MAAWSPVFPDDEIFFAWLVTLLSVVEAGVVSHVFVVFVVGCDQTSDVGIVADGLVFVDVGNWNLLSWCNAFVTNSGSFANTDAALGAGISCFALAPVSPFMVTSAAMHGLGFLGRFAAFFLENSTLIGRPLNINLLGTVAPGALVVVNVVGSNVLVIVSGIKLIGQHPESSVVDGHARVGSGHNRPFTCSTLSNMEGQSWLNSIVKVEFAWFG